MKSKLQNEIDFFDTEADQLLQLNDDELMVNDPCQHLAGSAIAFDYMLDSLGCLTDRKIMEVGSGSGWFSVYLAQKGAKLVHGIEVSPKMIEVAERRASVNNLSDRVQFEQRLAEDIRFERNIFDLIVGISVLHHVDIKAFCRNIKDHLQADGKAIFIEPLCQSSLTRFAREKIFSMLTSTTEGEEPLTFSIIDLMSDDLIVRHKEFQILGSVARFIGDRMTEKMRLNKLDNFMLSASPGLKKYCRLTVIELTHKKK